ncbi:MAG: twin-arginine translocation signal domain-containing protein [Cytophagales bacterium]|nr:twin-arginine translocation signal domain-containing protein [Cytophagales bacterium]
MTGINRRDFLRTGALATTVGATVGIGNSKAHPMKDGNYSRNFNDSYKGPFLNQVAFPLGGLGAGMVCLEGSGCISHVSVRNTPDIFNEPFMFGAVSIQGAKNKAKVLEGPVPRYKIFGRPNAGNGNTTYGYPRFNSSSFKARFPLDNSEL